MFRFKKLIENNQHSVIFHNFFLKGNIDQKCKIHKCP